MTARRLAWACAAAALLAACQSKAARLQERQLSTQARDLAADAAPGDTIADTVKSANIPIATNKPVVVNFILTDSGFIGPDSILGGAIDMRVTNRGKFTHELRFGLLPPRATAAFMAFVRGERSPQQRPPELDPRGGVGPLPPGGSSQFILTLGPGEYIILDALPAGDGKRWWQRGIIRPLRIFGIGPQTMQPPVMRFTAGILASDVTWRFAFAVNTGGDRSRPVEGRNRPTDMDAGRQLVSFEFVGGQKHDAVLYKAEDPFVMREYAAWLDQRRPAPPPGLVTGIPALYLRMKIYMWLPLEHGSYIIFCPLDHETQTKRGLGFEFGEFSQFVVK